MTEVVARAPGKLVWLGEYAVLAGAPAIVAAVDRYVSARVWPAADATWRIEAANLARAAQAWRGPAASRHGPLGFALRVLDALAARDRLPAPRHCVLDSRAFYAGEVKLGLGSSAAVGAALLRAIERSDGRQTDFATAFDLLCGVHAAQQGGRGSGVDVAAALSGGLQRFARGTPGAPARVEEVALPPDLHWCAIHTGSATSTARCLARLEDWQARHAAEYAAHMQALHERAAAGADALQAGHSRAFCASAGGYAEALQALGAAAGIDIVSRVHRDLARLAASFAVTYKPSGAGGGDLGVAFATDAEAMRGFGAAVARRTAVKLLNLELAPVHRQ